MALLPRLRLLRSDSAADQIELCLVSAIATVLVIRFVLELSGYPKLAGKGLHIAHVLYGGLIMLLALILLFTLLNVQARWVAAFIGGVGFGFFIDEVGKFISNDVNYFFQPAVAVMYVVFVVLFLLLYAIRRWERRLSPHDALANALHLLAGERDGSLDGETKREVVALLDQADGADPLVRSLRAEARALAVTDRRRLTWYPRMRARLAEGYRRLTARRRFHAAIVVIAVLYALASIPVHVTLQVDDAGVTSSASESSLAHWVQLGAGAAEVTFVVVGLLVLRRSRLDAYRWFMRAVLVSILITQVFAFYHDQFTALFGLAFDLLFYAALRFAIGREEAEARAGALVGPPPGTVAAPQPAEG